MGFIQTTLDPVFRPLLQLGPLVTLVIVSFCVSLISTLVYKWLTKQSEMKRLKDEIKGYQTQMKAARDTPEKVMELQKQAMALNMDYMKKSFTPTLVTMLPLLLIFGWLQATLAFMPILPGQEFTLGVVMQDGLMDNVSVRVPVGLEVVGETVKAARQQVNFTLKGVRDGEYIVDVVYGNVPYSKDIFVSGEQKYAEQGKSFSGPVKAVQIDYKKLIILPVGFRNWFGWLGLYIIFSLIFSMSLRKILKLH